MDHQYYLIHNPPREARIETCKLVHDSWYTRTLLTNVTKLGIKLQCHTHFAYKSLTKIRQHSKIHIKNWEIICHITWRTIDTNVPNFHVIKSFKLSSHARTIWKKSGKTYNAIHGQRTEIRQSINNPQYSRNTLDG